MTRSLIGTCHVQNAVSTQCLIEIHNGYENNSSGDNGTSFTLETPPLECDSRVETLSGTSGADRYAEYQEPGSLEPVSGIHVVNASTPSYTDRHTKNQDNSFPERVSALDIVSGSAECPSKSIQDTKGSRIQATPFTKTARFISAPINAQNPSKKCPYVDHISGERCHQVNKNEIDWTKTRHWLTVHLLKEAKAISTGVLNIGESSLITSELALQAVRSRLLKCKICGKVFTRVDSFKRHEKKKHPTLKA